MKLRVLPPARGSPLQHPQLYVLPWLPFYSQLPSVFQLGKAIIAESLHITAHARNAGESFWDIKSPLHCHNLLMKVPQIQRGRSLRPRETHPARWAHGCCPGFSVIAARSQERRREGAINLVIRITGAGFHPGDICPFCG